LLPCASLPEKAAPKRSADADTNFAYYFRESLSVLTNAFLLASADKDRRILLYDPPIKIPRKHGAEPLYLSITQTYRVVEAEDGTTRANSTSYSYGLLAKQNGEFCTIIEFHSDSLAPIANGLGLRFLPCHVLPDPKIAVTDQDGKPVHEECYVLKLRQEDAKKPPKTR
jgi:hypothetical protein